MEKTRIYKPEPPEVCGTCVTCKVAPQSTRGYGRYRALCFSCHNDRYPATNAYRRDYMRARREHEGFVEAERNARQKVGYKAFKKAYCEDCDFVAVEPCQLDVDHVDGNRANNSPENLRTLCANCHRLKTHRERNFRKASSQPHGDISHR